MIEVPKAAIELAKRFEGFERKVKRGIEITAVPYICPAGFWTIGYGHLCDPKHPPITEAEAEVYLARDLQTALTATLRYCPVLATEPEARLAAIVDFTFNLGVGRLQTSTLRRRINRPLKKCPSKQPRLCLRRLSTGWIRISSPWQPFSGPAAGPFAHFGRNEAVIYA